MLIVSIEPTPSPNSMKLNMNETLNPGVRLSYTSDNVQNAPGYVQRLLGIPGVVGVFHTADFIAVDRHPKGDWQSILAAAREILGIAQGDHKPSMAGDTDQDGSEIKNSGGPVNGQTQPPHQAAEGWGEVHVFIQSFRGIPMQVRVQSEGEESRAALPERFSKAALVAGLASPNLIKERKLVDQGVRYGELQEVLEEVVRETEAAYDEERLNELVRLSGNLAPGEAPDEENATAREAEKVWNDPDWRKRYAVLQRMKPTEDSLPLLVKALDDPQMSVRRLATVYLGDLKIPEALPHLFHALKDSSSSVRRTAGDTLSDLGDPAAIGPMTAVLKDKNKLVRWRAARFLFEAGDETAVPALRDAQDDPEFEVNLQVRLALERIEGGEAAAGSVWQQMTNRKKE